MMLIAYGAGVLAERGWDGPGPWWPIFPIAWLLIIATAVTIFIVSARRRSRLAGRRAGERRLAERYADGEIDDQEYARRLATLRSTSGS